MISPLHNSEKQISKWEKGNNPEEVINLHQGLEEWPCPTAFVLKLKLLCEASLEYTHVAQVRNAVSRQRVI